MHVQTAGLPSLHPILRDHLLRGIAASLGLPLPLDPEPDDPGLAAARALLDSYAARTLAEATLAADAIALRAVRMDACRRALDPDLPHPLAARLHRSIATLGRSLSATQAELDRRQAQPLSREPERSPAEDRPSCPAPLHAPEQACPPPDDRAGAGGVSRAETIEQNPMQQKPRGLPDDDLAERERDSDTLARFVSRRLTPEQSVLDAWTLAAGDAGEATISMRIIDPTGAAASSDAPWRRDVSSETARSVASSRRG